MPGEPVHLSPLLFFVPFLLAVTSSCSIFFSRNSCFLVNISSVSRSRWIASWGLAHLPPFPLLPNNFPNKDILPSGRQQGLILRLLDLTGHLRVSSICHWLNRLVVVFSASSSLTQAAWHHHVTRTWLTSWRIVSLPFCQWFYFTK